MFVLLYQLTFDPLIMYLPWPTSTLWSVNGHQRSLPPILFPGDYLTTADFSLFWFQLLPSTRVNSKSIVKNIPSLEELFFKDTFFLVHTLTWWNWDLEKCLVFKGKPVYSMNERKSILSKKKQFQKCLCIECRYLKGNFIKKHNVKTLKGIGKDTRYKC